jgi:hypothetical protein
MCGCLLELEKLGRSYFSFIVFGGISAFDDSIEFDRPQAKNSDREREYYRDRIVA